ncbi:hypothetical protein ANCDUO_26421 [Ancylostoma duodenale]|uniref:Endonuclease/exonuclease/phosphatase domain-containing protein n=1 Tax=Ancylostoma duodenale TaxID=51022 RepID=A0A0C2F4W1_9BILA|nr:hypothetical protein ANCDUO_26421 [Ancylostoma duodenale]
MLNHLNSAGGLSQARMRKEEGWLCDGLPDSGSDFLTKEHHAYRDLKRAHAKPDWASRPASPEIRQLPTAHPRPYRSSMEGKWPLQQCQQYHLVFQLRRKARKRSRICLEQTGSQSTGRMETARFLAKHIRITVIQVYAPTDNSEEDMKNDFYGLLQDAIDEAPQRDLKVVLGDFNAQLDGDRHGIEEPLDPLHHQGISVTTASE